MSHLQEAREYHHLFAAPGIQKLRMEGRLHPCIQGACFCLRYVCRASWLLQVCTSYRHACRARSRAQETGRLLTMVVLVTMIMMLLTMLLTPDEGHEYIVEGGSGRG